MTDEEVRLMGAEDPLNLLRRIIMHHAQHTGRLNCEVEAAPFRLASKFPDILGEE